MRPCTVIDENANIHLDDQRGSQAEQNILKLIITDREASSHVLPHGISQSDKLFFRWRNIFILGINRCRNDAFKHSNRIHPFFSLSISA